MLKYKGYIGHVEFDADAEIFHGEIVNTRDVETLKQEFIDSVEDYLEFCAARGEQPDKPFSGNFMVRLTPELHKDVYIAAKTAGLSLNAWVAKTLENSTGV